MGGFLCVLYATSEELFCRIVTLEPSLQWWVRVCDWGEILLAEGTACAQRKDMTLWRCQWMKGEHGKASGHVAGRPGGPSQGRTCVYMKMSGCYSGGAKKLGKRMMWLDFLFFLNDHFAGRVEIVLVVVWDWQGNLFDSYCSGLGENATGVNQARELGMKNR